MNVAAAPLCSDRSRRGSVQQHESGFRYLYMRRILVCVSLAALLAAGCGEISGTDGSAAVASIDRDKVTPGDLQAAVQDERVKAFYAARGWQPVWTDDLAEKLEAAMGD